VAVTETADEAHDKVATETGASTLFTGAVLLHKHRQQIGLPNGTVQPLSEPWQEG
jgi:hypothetical protein